MESHILIAFIVVAVVATAAAVLISRHLAARRRDALAAAALGLGFEFLQKLQAHEVAPAGMRTLSRGRSHTFHNALRGRRGDTEVLLVDHHYVTGGGKNSSHHRRSLVVLRRPGLALPAFFMRPQVPLFDTIGKMAGGKDLDFAEDDAFSRAFVLQTGDEDAVRRVFGLEVRQQMLGLGRAFEVEAGGDVVQLQRASRVPPDDAMRLLETATALLDVLATAARPRSRW